jgi:UDP-N-acetylmuramyl-tripeptide synthetase
MTENAEVHPIRHRMTPAGNELVLDFFGRPLELHSRLFGRHNLYNVMAAATACSLLGISDADIEKGINDLASVPGRFERLLADVPFSVFIDFAHSPDALKNALQLAAAVSNERVICVFGCGGDRDRAKRPLMGRIATREADLVIITSDNPRSEDPSAIIDEVCAGIPDGTRNFERIPNRREAIFRALELAEAGDLILLAGKGHELYQEIAGRKHHFDEREIVREALCLN